MTYYSAENIQKYAKNEIDLDFFKEYAENHANFNDFEQFDDETFTLTGFVKAMNESIEYGKSIPKTRPPIKKTIQYSGKNNKLDVNLTLTKKCLLPTRMLNEHIECFVPIDLSKLNQSVVLFDGISLREQEVKVHVNTECCVCMGEITQNIYTCPYCHGIICNECLIDYIENVNKYKQCDCPTCHMKIDVLQAITAPDGKIKNYVNIQADDAENECQIYTNRMITVITLKKSIEQTFKTFDRSIINSILYSTIPCNHKFVSITYNQIYDTIECFTDTDTRSKLFEYCFISTRELNDIGNKYIETLYNMVATDQQKIIFSENHTDNFEKFVHERCTNLLIAYADINAKTFEEYITQGIDFILNVKSNDNEYTYKQCTRRCLELLIMKLFIYTKAFTIALKSFAAEEEVDVFATVTTNEAYIKNDIETISTYEKKLLDMLNLTMSDTKSVIERMYQIFETLLFAARTSKEHLSKPAAQYIVCLLENVMAQYHFTDDVTRIILSNSKLIHTIIATVDNYTFNYERICDSMIEKYENLMHKCFEHVEFTAKCQHCEHGKCDSHYVCGSCGYKLCPTCDVSYAVINTEHVCNKEDIDTFKEIKENTVACPWCFTRSNRLKGCKDFFCFNCHHMFNYETGEKIINERENPELSDFKRKRGIFAKAAFDTDIELFEYCIIPRLCDDGKCAFTAKNIRMFQRLVEFFNGTTIADFKVVLYHIHLANTLIKNNIVSEKKCSYYSLTWNSDRDKVFNLINSFASKQSYVIDHHIMNFEELIRVYTFLRNVVLDFDAHYQELFNIVHKIQTIWLNHSAKNKSITGDTYNTLMTLFQLFEMNMNMINENITREFEELREQRWG